MSHSSPWEPTAARLREIIDLVVRTGDDETPPPELADVLDRARELLEPYAADPQDAVRAFWQRLSGVHGQSRALIGGPANPLAPVVRWDKAEDAWVGRTTLGVGYQGPPGRVHGGMVAALLDSVLGRAQPRDGLRFTRTLTIDYLAATPLFTELVIRARPDDPGGRKVWITGEVEADGVVTATARGLWVAPRTVPADAPGDLGLELGRPGPAAST